MLRNNLHYTIGNYCESPEGVISTSGPALLAQTLAWAVKNDIPFQEVILSLADRGYEKSNRKLFLLPRSKRWNACLTAAYFDLIHGYTLSQALRRRFEYFLPEYYLQAVEQADAEDRLKEVLPVFAKRLNFVSQKKIFYKRALAFPFLELLLVLFLATLEAIFLLPNYVRIADGLVVGEKLSPAGVIIMLQFIFILIILGLLTLLVLYSIGRLIPKFHLWLNMFVGEFMRFVPIKGEQIRSSAYMELAASMASYLDAGEDIITAALYSEKACEHWWLKRKLKLFISALQKGENWLDAWSKMKLKQNIGELIIRNSAANEDLAGGFDIIADWFYHKQYRTLKSNAVWLMIGITLLSSYIVYSIATFIFTFLAKFIEALG